MKRFSIFLGAAGFSLLVASVLFAGPPVVKGYRNAKTMNGEIRALAQSRYASYRSLARTLKGHDIGVLTVGTGKTDRKPAILVVGGVDPTRLVDAEVTLRVARRLVEAAKSDKKIRHRLEHVTFYFVALAAPDGTGSFFEKPHRERHVNARPTDDDTDGRIDEDGPEDLNGDGLITMMRVKDPEGKYIPHPDDDRVLIAADPSKGERGVYELYVEGRDNDGDGHLNEDPPGGVAFDRNFPFNYDYFSRGAGPHQVSEIETRAIADFAFDRPNVVLVWTLSDRDNMLNKWEPNENAEQNPIKKTLLAADAPYFDKFVDIYEDIRDMDAGKGTADGKGAWVEWAYFHYGRWSIATSPWSIPTESQEDKEEEDEEKKKPKKGDQGDQKKEGSEDSSKKSDKEKRGAEKLRALAWLKQREVDGFVAWKPIKHPDLEDEQVEVGGFRPFVRNNPPVDQLDALAGDQYQFMLQVCDMLPRVKISDVKAEPLGGNIWRVTAAMVNEGVLPTVSEMGRITGVPQRLQVELDLPSGTTLVTGHGRRSVKPLAGNGGQQEEKWLVRSTGNAEKKLTIRVWSPMVEGVERIVTLHR
ncbi:MAG: M14 family metallopeptidase [Planctomycetota bacterium]